MYAIRSYYAGLRRRKTSNCRYCIAAKRLWRAMQRRKLPCRKSASMAGPAIPRPNCPAGSSSASPLPGPSSRITSYNVCYTKLLRVAHFQSMYGPCFCSRKHVREVCVCDATPAVQTAGEFVSPPGATNPILFPASAEVIRQV